MTLWPCQSTRFCAGVSVAPVSDWRLYDTHHTERYMGLPIDNDEGYAKSNVINQIHALKSPLLQCMAWQTTMYCSHIVLFLCRHSKSTGRILI